MAGLPGQRDEVVVEVQPAEDPADERHDQVADDRIDDLAEGAADDHADGQVDDVALEREFLELGRETHAVYSLWLMRRAALAALAASIGQALAVPTAAGAIACSARAAGPAQCSARIPG